MLYGGSMYNHMLDTFIAVVDCGSFTKALQQLYISPTVIMKQMNALENHLELKLIERAPSGVQLTSAGEIIYRNAKFMIDYSHKSIAEAKASVYANDIPFASAHHC